MRITYEAKRDIVTGHVLGDEYVLVLGASGINPRRRRHVNRQESLEPAVVETDYYGSSRAWSITTEELEGTLELEFLEFWESVAAGEYFQFDPYATTAELQPRTCHMVSEDLNPVRLGTSNLFAYSFRIQEI